MKHLIEKLMQVGTKLPKKHGSWYLLNVYNSHYLVLDTWNKTVYHYPNGATPSDTNNMYRVVYVFYDNDGGQRHEVVQKRLADFWYAHIYHL